MKHLLVIAIAIYFPSICLATSKPHETQIYYHLHQITRWAELKYSKKCYISESSMKNHLAKIKYNNPRLVDSEFYQFYLFFRDIAFEMKTSTLLEVEKNRDAIHQLAEQLKIPHPVNWQLEFLACTSEEVD